MTRDEALSQALLNLQAAERKVATLNTIGEAAQAVGLRVRIARGYVEFATELGVESNYRQA